VAPIARQSGFDEVEQEERQPERATISIDVDNDPSILLRLRRPD
jgi:hypothetical protein